MKKQYYLFLYIISAIIAIVPIIFSILKGNVYCDEGYYLSIVDCIGKGYIPYKTLNLGYSPLWFYILAGIKSIFSIPDCLYEPYLIIHYFTVLTCAFLIYKILFIFIHDFKVSYISSLLFIIASHWLRGGYVLLEMPSVLFGLLSIFFLLRKKKEGRKDNRTHLDIFCSGICASCACLCKQYGIGFIVIGLFILIWNNRTNLKHIIIFALGIAPAFILCILFWKHDFLRIWFSDYGAINSSSIFIREFLLKLKQILRATAYLLIMIFPGLFLCIFNFKNPIDKETRILYFTSLFGIFGFLLQFFFNNSLHYYIYILPFVCLLFGLLLNWSNKQHLKIKIICYCVLLLTFGEAIFHTYFRNVYKMYIKGEGRSCYYIVGHRIHEIIPQNSTIYIPFEYGPYEQYFFSGICPPNLASIGYSFGELGLSPQNRQIQSSTADYIIVRSNSQITDKALQIELDNRKASYFDEIGVIIYSTNK